MRILILFLVSSTLHTCNTHCVSKVKALSSTDNGVCEMLKDIPNSINTIKNNSRTIKDSNDSCVLGLLDSLTNRFIKESDLKYIVCLDSISRISDGYVSEYFLVISKKLLYNNFKKYINYLYKQKNHSNVLKDFLIDGISMEIATAKNKEEKEKEVKKYIETEQLKQKLSSAENAYLKEIISHIDIHKFD